MVATEDADQHAGAVRRAHRPPRGRGRVRGRTRRRSEGATPGRGRPRSSGRRSRPRRPCGPRWPRSGADRWRPRWTGPAPRRRGRCPARPATCGRAARAPTVAAPDSPDTMPAVGQQAHAVRRPCRRRRPRTSRSRPTRRARPPATASPQLSPAMTDRCGPGHLDQLAGQRPRPSRSWRCRARRRSARADAARPGRRYHWAAAAAKAPTPIGTSTTSGCGRSGGGELGVDLGEDRRVAVDHPAPARRRSRATRCRRSTRHVGRLVAGLGAARATASS